MFVDSHVNHKYILQKEKALQKRGKNEQISKKTCYGSSVCRIILRSIIKIPTPGTGGYIHPGDAIVILSGVFLGPVYGLFAGGIGSALSDLIGGYFIYVPITFVIKGLIAFASGFVFQKFGKDRVSKQITVALCGIIDIVLVRSDILYVKYLSIHSQEQQQAFLQILSRAWVDL